MSLWVFITSVLLPTPAGGSQPDACEGAVAVLIVPDNEQAPIALFNSSSQRNAFL